jgi:hypothetical protein
MALLGAKRPQHRAWQFVVLSLWVILARPAAQSLLFQSDGRLNVHPLEQALVLSLVAMEAANYLATPRWLCGLLVAAGQLTLLAGPLGLPDAGDWAAPAGLSLVVTAGVLATWRTVGWQFGVGDVSPAQRSWLTFRNAYGLFWAARVWLRINAAATAENRRETLGWNGRFGTRGAGREVADTAAAWRSLRGHLRLFLAENQLDPVATGR